MSTSFPDGFTWGTATAAHQIEGGNWNNDWWQWEHTPGSGCAESSGDGCDSWNRWPEDVALCRELGFDNYRFSIEWSRIEPEEGEWSAAAIAHYRAQCEALLAAGVDPVVTFHHFTTPRWLAAKGGWSESSTADAFARFCGRAAGRARRRDSPGVHDQRAEHRVDHRLPRRRVPARQAGRRVAPQGQRCVRRRASQGGRRDPRAAPGVPVGLTLAMEDYQAVDGGESKRDQIRYRMQDEFLEATEGDDFVGVQTYTRSRVGPNGTLPNEEGVPVLPMGYEFWPDALPACLARAWEVTKGEIPLLVTENGIGTDDDEQRIEYVQSALEGVLRAIADGIDVRGLHVLEPARQLRVGLRLPPALRHRVVDRTTFERTPKPSAHWLGKIAKENAL